MMRASVHRIVVTILLCAALVSAQTFQYSRGWTNGRKRNGMMVLAPRLGAISEDRLLVSQEPRAAALAAAATLLQDAGLLSPSLAPCSHRPANSLQRIHSALDSRTSVPVTSQDRDEESADRRRRQTMVHQ